MRLVSSNDMESLNVNAAYLSETLQPIPYTPFAALMARQINNESASTVQDARSTGRFTIGLLGKASVKEVWGLLRIYFIYYFAKLFLIGSKRHGKIKSHNSQICILLLLFFLFNLYKYDVCNLE